MIFFIDYENVSSAGLDGIETLSEKDTVIIFYNMNSAINMKNHFALVNSKCQKNYYQVNQTSKNALDFQLSTYLGFMINKEKTFA